MKLTNQQKEKITKDYAMERHGNDFSWIENLEWVMEQIEKLYETNNIK